MNCTTCKRLCKVKSLAEEDLGYVCTLFSYVNEVYKINNPDVEGCEEYSQRFDLERDI